MSFGLRKTYCSPSIGWHQQLSYEGLTYHTSNTCSFQSTFRKMNPVNHVESDSEIPSLILKPNWSTIIEVAWKNQHVPPGSNPDVPGGWGLTLGRAAAFWVRDGGWDMGQLESKQGDTTWSYDLRVLWKILHPTLFEQIEAWTKIR